MSIATKSARRHSGRNIPKKHRAVAAGRDKGLVVRRNGKTQNLVAMGCVGLDQPSLGNGGLSFLGTVWDSGAGKRVVEPDGAV